MTRRMLIALSFTAVSHVPAKPRYPSLNPSALLEFHTHYNRFFRDYFGCGDAAWSDDCRPKTGVLNAKEWEATCDAARRAFHLEP